MLDAQKGFTLLEMMVVVAIIGVLSTILIVNQNTFNKNNILNDAAYTVALSIRQMQSYGLSSRNFVATTTSTYTPNTGYGIHFGDSNAYYDTFADIYPAVGSELNTYGYNCPHPVGDNGTPAARPGDCLYEYGNGEQVQRYKFNNGYTISSICYYHPNSSCFTPPVNNATQKVDILYERPNNQAFINYSSFGSTLSFNPAITKACIQLTSPQGGTRSVMVTTLGEVYVVTTSCPSS